MRDLLETAVTEPISPERLAEIQDCERETREGPWALTDANDGDGTPPFWVVSTAQDVDEDWSVEIHVGDKGVGEFIAIARTVVPELLAYVADLSKENEHFRSQLNDDSAKMTRDAAELNQRRQQAVDADGRALAAETERDVALAERDQAREMARYAYRRWPATIFWQAAAHIGSPFTALPAWLTDTDSEG